MSFKTYIPTSINPWKDYWEERKIEEELDWCKTDELGPLFRKELKKNSLILEAGSGLGKWVITLSGEGYNIIGTDNYTEGLLRSKRYKSTMKYLSADILKLPLKNNSIDAYLSLGVVEHFEEGPHKALREAYRVLKSQGIAFVEVPFDNLLRQINRNFYTLKKTIKTPGRVLLEYLKLRPKKQNINTQFYEFHYTETELRKFVKDVGFKLKSLLPKDDSHPGRSIGLWLDFPSLRHESGVLFLLNNKGKQIKKLLRLLSPKLYSALIVAIVEK